MRRKNPLTVNVKSPSRGLVSRLPSELADRLREEDVRRTFVAAQNVRFEDGVVAAAPGYETAVSTGGTDFSANLLAHWRFNETVLPYYDQTANDHDFIQSAAVFFDDSAAEPSTVSGKLGNAVKSLSTDPADGFYNGLALLESAFDLSGSSFTVTGWFRLDDAADDLRIVGRGLTTDSPVIYDGGFLSSTYDPLDAYLFEWDLMVTGTALRFNVCDASGVTASVTSAVTLTEGQWYFFAAVHTQGAGIKIRVNATTSAQTAHTTGVRGISPSLLNIFTVTQDAQPVGSLDSLSIFNAALSGTQLDALYNSGAGMDYPFLGGPVRFAFQGNYLQSDPFPLLLGTDTKMYAATRDFTSDPRQYSVALTSLYTHPGSTTSENRWSAADFYDKIVFAQADINPRYWTTGTSVSFVAGLPESDTYDGVTAFQNHLLLWKDLSLKWSDLNNLSNWIPVSNTVASLRLTTDNAFSQPDATIAATTPVPPLTGAVYVTEYPDGLTVGQYLSIEESGNVNYYELMAVTPGAELSAVTVASSQTVGSSATSARIFLTEHKEWELGQIIKFGAATNYHEVQSVSPVSTEAYVLNSAATLVDSGSSDTATIILTASTNAFKVGDYVSVGPSASPGYDIYYVNAVRTNVSTSHTELDLIQQNQGSNQRTPAAGALPQGATVVPQPWVVIKDYNNTAVTVSSSLAVVEKYGLVLKPLALTGRRTAATNVGAASPLATLDANEAGEMQVVGADDNGAIWAVVPLGDYAAVLKNRSIQVLQYVGRISGTFFARTEVRNEGLLARNSWVRLNSDRLVFVGNREIYLYRGGQSPTPIIPQYSRQFFAELDRGRLNDIQMLHNEPRNEVWIVYPTPGSQKVLVWNYVEDTVTLDLYNPSLLELTALAQCRWENDPAWNDLSEQQLWNTLSDTVTWLTIGGSGNEQVTFVATGDGSMLIHGRSYSHGGEDYTASAETMDFDFRDPSVVKHVDGVQLSFQVANQTTQTKTIYVQIGTKMNADAPVTWSAAKSLSVSGAGQNPTRVPFSQTGRFVRLRIYSEDAEVRWRCSGYQIFARAGGTY